MPKIIYGDDLLFHDFSYTDYSTLSNSRFRRDDLFTKVWQRVPIYVHSQRKQHEIYKLLVNSKQDNSMSVILYRRVCYMVYPVNMQMAMLGFVLL